MGLDFSHGNAHWSYSGFSRFREKLAAGIGIDLQEMEGFGGTRPFSEVADDLVPLLDHSDCDGDLSVSQCIQVSTRLRHVVSSWSDEDDDKDSALELAAGMERAVANNEPFEFV